jgi:paraquat-inducible protein A
MTDLPSPPADLHARPRSGPRGQPLARALIILAAFFLPLGLFLPVLETTRLWVFKSSYSLLDTVRGLYENGELALALLIAIFSLVTPALKLVLVTALHLRGAISSPGLARWVERLGKWSLTDVLVVAILIVIWSGTGLQLTTQPGLWFFAASAICLMLASGLITKNPAGTP